jgi:hypothetical protein
MSGSEVTAPFREAMPGDISSYDVEGDLTTLEYCFVELDTVRARTVKAYAGGLAAGLLCNRPIEDATSTAFSTVAQVQYKGKGLVKAGSGGLAPGDWVKATTGGVGIKATPTAGDVIYGQCEVGAVEGLPATMRFVGPFIYAVS